MTTMNNQKAIAAAKQAAKEFDQLLIVEVMKTSEEKTIIVPMGDYSVDGEMFIVPSVTIAVPINEWDGTLPECDPDLYPMTTVEFGNHMLGLGVKKLDKVNAFTPEGCYALPYCAIDAVASRPY